MCPRNASFCKNRECVGRKLLSRTDSIGYCNEHFSEYSEATQQLTGMIPYDAGLAKGPHKFIFALIITLTHPWFKVAPNYTAIIWLDTWPLKHTLSLESCTRFLVYHDRRANPRAQLKRDLVIRFVSSSNPLSRQGGTSTTCTGHDKSRQIQSRSAAKLAPSSASHALNTTNSSGLPASRGNSTYISTASYKCLDRLQEGLGLLDMQWDDLIRCCYRCNQYFLVEMLDAHLGFINWTSFLIMLSKDIAQIYVTKYQCIKK